MLLVWKNKGLLVLLYFVVCTIATASLIAFLSRNVGGIFSKIDIYTGLGFSFLFAAIWTYLTKDDFYLDKYGKKKKMDTQNELYWMSMRTWSLIYLVISLVLFGNLIFKYFPPENL